MDERTEAEKEIIQTKNKLILLYKLNQQYDEALQILREEQFPIDEAIRTTAREIYGRKIQEQLQLAERELEGGDSRYHVRIYRCIDSAQELASEARKKGIDLEDVVESQLKTSPAKTCTKLAKAIQGRTYWGLTIPVLNEAAKRGIIIEDEAEIRADIKYRENQAEAIRAADRDRETYDVIHNYEQWRRDNK